MNRTRFGFPQVGEYDTVFAGSMMNRSKTLASCALALVLSVGAAAQPATSKAPDPPFSEGYAAFQKGDFETAAKQWQAAQIEFDREKNAARQVDVRLNLA